MGHRTALVRFQRSNAVLGIDRSALEIARIDIGYARNARAALARVKIGIEHAVRSRKLQFGPVALADLEARPTEMLAQFIRSHSIQ